MITNPIGGDTYSELWKFYATPRLLFTTRFRGKIVIISAWLHRNIAIALRSRRQLFARIRSARANDLRFVFSFFASDTFDVDFGPKHAFNPAYARARAHTHTNLFSTSLFRLLHFSRPPLLTSSCYLSLAAYSPGKNILGQEWDLWICGAKSWVVFMVRVLLPHFRAYRVTMYLCQWRI